MIRARTQDCALWLSENAINQSVARAPDHDASALESAQLLFNRIKVGFEHLSSRMCPVQLANGQGQVWVLVEYAHDDQAKALALAIAQSGIALAKPARLIVSAAWLSQINRRLQSDGAKFQGFGSRVSTPKHVLMSLLDDLLAHALQCDASDIHLTIRYEGQWADVAFTINGVCVRAPKFAQLPVCTVQELLAVCWMTVQGGNGAVFDPTCEQQGRFERQLGSRSIHLRWASLVIQAGVSVCWRLLNRMCWQSPPSLQTLGYAEQDLQRLQRATQGMGGLVVFAGLVGSGKSTSLAAMMQTIPSERKVITLEDPVEYTIANALQCPVAGFDHQSAHAQLASKLKTIKRSAAHDVLIGELRDELGAQAVVDLVLAGSTVYTTVHACSAVQIFTRLSSSLIGVPASLLTMPDFIKLLVYQVLVKQLCQGCALTAQEWLGAERETGERLSWLKQAELALGGDWQTWRFRDPEGCVQCAWPEAQVRTGYGARLLVAEFVEPAATPGFYEQLTQSPLSECVARWQRELTPGPSSLVGYEPVSQRALALVQKGRLDPRDYCARFAPLGAVGRSTP